MTIDTYINNFKTHPVLFAGTGISLRYLENSYDWKNLLKTICDFLHENTNVFFDYLNDCAEDTPYSSNPEISYEKVASILQDDFKVMARNEQGEKFEKINKLFYEEMRSTPNSDRLKLYISLLLEENLIKSEMDLELEELRKARKNIGSIVTTNYDTFLENFFEFKPLIGNDIILSNPYGAVYKIHGCVTKPQSIIITEEDYIAFDEKYDLIRAQLVSLFIHKPIIFLGYALGDNNIRQILKTIFMYVDPNSTEAKRIRENFLLVEREEGSSNSRIEDYDITIDGLTVRIKKLKTDNFVQIYKGISQLSLPISVMDIRKVEGVLRSINRGEGNAISVRVADNLDQIDNDMLVLAIGPSTEINYNPQRPSSLVENYFSIIEEENINLIAIINNLTIPDAQWFPIYYFSDLCGSLDLEKVNKLKKQQKDKIGVAFEGLVEKGRDRYLKEDDMVIADIIENKEIATSNKMDVLFLAFLMRKIKAEDMKRYLKECIDTRNTDYRRLVTAYDYLLYSDTSSY